MDFDFYAGTLALAKRNPITYLKAMRSVADTNSPGWYEMFPSCLWHPELFIARHEATRADPPT
jgi:hypothetical protein